MAILQILVPVDYSPCSAAALVVAAEFAQRFDVPIDVVHVWDRPSYVTDKALVRDANGVTKSLIQMIADNAQAEMDAFLRDARLPPTVRVERHLWSGDPVTRILEELRQGRHDLVVMGTHGRGGLQHVLMGSVAEKLVRLSPVPVLTVPKPG